MPSVVDVPYVQRLQLEYHFPAYTGLEVEKIEDGGDIAVLKGTEVRVHITPTMKTPGGRIALNDKDSVALTAQPDGTLKLHFAVENPSGKIIDALASSGSIDGNFLADRIKSYSDKMRSEESKTTMNFMSYYEALARNKASDAGSDND